MIGCQSLLQQSPEISGWLRRKSQLVLFNENLSKKIPHAKSFTSKFNLSWDRRYVVLHKGSLHIYADETAEKPEKVLKLRDYAAVTESEESKSKDVPWPFMLVGDDKNEYFSATSKNEQMNWIECMSHDIEASQSASSSGSGRPLPQPPLNEPKDPKPRPRPRSPETPDPSDDRKPGLRSSPSLLAAATSPKKKVPSPPGPTKPGSFDQGKAPSKPQVARVVPQPPARSPIEDPAESTIGRPALPKKPPTPDAKPTKKPVEIPKVPARKAGPSQPVSPDTEENPDGVLYEDLGDDSLVTQALWDGNNKDAQSALEKCPEGTFMLRESSTGDGLTLLVRFEAVILKYPIKFLEEDKRLINNKTFENMDELLDYYYENDFPHRDLKLKQPFKNVAH